MARKKRLWWTSGLVVVLLALLAYSWPAGSEAKEHEMASADNHFKCYSILDWTEFSPKKAELKDQFGGSLAYVTEPRMLCNPVDKNGEGIADKEYHLVCYSINDDPTGPTERVKEVEIANQFQEGPLWVGMGELLCVPSRKSYRPRY